MSALASLPLAVVGTRDRALRLCERLRERLSRSRLLRRDLRLCLDDFFLLLLLLLRFLSPSELSLSLPLLL